MHLDQTINRNFIKILGGLFLLNIVLNILSFRYIFLIWNLILAWVPLGLSSLIESLEEKKSRSKIYPQIFLAILWMLFYPNTIYLLTDLAYVGAFHPSAWPYAPTNIQPSLLNDIWIDIPIIFLAVLNALLLGYVSLQQMHNFFQKKFTRVAGWIFLGAIWVLSSMGVFLGRFLRWNSWDALLHPLEVMKDIFGGRKFSLAQALLFVMLYTIVQMVIYFSFYTLQEKNQKR